MCTCLKAGLHAVHSYLTWVLESGPLMHHTHGRSWVPVARISLIILLSPQSVDDEKSRVLETMRPRRLQTASAINAGGTDFTQTVANSRISTSPLHANRITRVAFV